MQQLTTLFLVLAPLFIGFAVRLPTVYLPLLEKGLSGLVYAILLLIGMDLAQVENIWAQMDNIAFYAVILFALLMLFNIVALILLDKYLNTIRMMPHTPRAGMKGLSSSVQQIGVLLLGVILGSLLPENFLPPHQASTVALMLLVGLVGMQLRGNGITIKQVLLNKQGLFTAMVFMLSCAFSGSLFALIMPNVSWTQGLALSSGYGWYSLSGIAITHAYGAQWGSIALFNDLLREFFAFVSIPLLMRRFPCAAVGVGGATSMDFTLPIIQQSGGAQIVPAAISFGFIVNLAAPILMLLFATF